jgi:hypothetical protein
LKFGGSWCGNLMNIEVWWHLGWIWSIWIDLDLKPYPNKKWRSNWHEIGFKHVRCNLDVCPMLLSQSTYCSEGVANVDPSWRKRWCNYPNQHMSQWWVWANVEVADNMFKLYRWFFFVNICVI